MLSDSGKMKTCRHCGGAMIDAVDEFVCVMCGRASWHSCDNCQFPDLKAVSTPQQKPSRKKANAA